MDDGIKRYVNGTLLRRNSVSTVGRQLFSAAAQVATVIMIARALGPEKNGQYAMAILLPTMLANFLNLGIPSATVYFLSGKLVDVDQVVRGNLFFGVVLTILGFSIGLPIISVFGGAVFPGVPENLLLLGLLIFPINLIQSLLVAVLQGLENFRWYNVAQITPPLITLLLSCLLVFANDSVEVLILAYASGQLVGLLLSLHFTRKIRLTVPPHQRRLEKTFNFKKRLLTYGWKAYLSNVMTLINYRSDLYMVNFLLAPEATGIYVIAIQIAERLWMLSQAVSTVLFPRLAAMTGDPIGRYRLTMKAAFFVGLATLLAATVLIVVVYFLLDPVFGGHYNASFESFLWLLPGVVAGACARIFANCIAAAGKPDWNMYAGIVVGMISVLGNWWLIPVFGIVGAAMASTFAYCVNALVKALLARKQRFWQSHILSGNNRS